MSFLHYTVRLSYTQDMLTLHDANDLIKATAKWGGIALVGFLLLFGIFKGGAFLVKVLFPKEPAPPKVAFGKLPPLIFPKTTTPQLTYRLDTVTGGLGSFSDRLNVYKIIPPVPNLLNLQTTRHLLQSTPFVLDESPLTDTVYSWGDTNRPDKKISYNIVSSDFSITSNYFSYTDLLTVTPVMQQDAIAATIKFLKDLNLYPLDLDEKLTTTQLLSMQGANIFAATSPSTAQLVRIDFFQKDVNKLPIVYPHPPYSTMHFLLGGRNTSELVDAGFSHQTVGTDNTTYPLLTVQQAFDLLKNHKAYIASYFGHDTNVSIKDIYLAYYLGEDKQQYLMPVYVFAGKDGFVAYVSAVSDIWIQK